jgi:hypothetical protein
MPSQSASSDSPWSPYHVRCPPRTSAAAARLPLVGTACVTVVCVDWRCLGLDGPEVSMSCLTMSCQNAAGSGGPGSDGRPVGVSRRVSRTGGDASQHRMDVPSAGSTGISPRSNEAQPKIPREGAEASDDARSAELNGSSLRAV